MNKEDIRMDDYYDVLCYMFEHDRSEWKDIISEYITDIDKETGFISINNCSPILATLESFSVDYRGKYNVGDYVTTKNNGGYYRVIALPYLDTRWKDVYNQWDESNSVNIGRLEQFAVSYTLAGIDNEGKPSGTEYYMYFENHDEYGKSLRITDCVDQNLILIDPGDKKETIDYEAGKLFNFLDENK